MASENELPPEILTNIFLFVRGPPASGALDAARLTCARWREIIDAHVAREKPREPYISLYKWDYLSPVSSSRDDVLYQEIIKGIQDMVSFVACSGDVAGLAALRSFLDATDARMGRNSVSSVRAWHRLNSVDTLIKSGQWDTFDVDFLTDNIEFIQARDVPRARELGVRFEDGQLGRRLLTATKAQDVAAWTEQELSGIVRTFLRNQDREFVAWCDTSISWVSVRLRFDDSDWKAYLCCAIGSGHRNNDTTFAHTLKRVTVALDHLPVTSGLPELAIDHAALLRFLSALRTAPPNFLPSGTPREMFMRLLRVVYIRTKDLVTGFFPDAHFGKLLMDWNEALLAEDYEWLFTRVEGRGLGRFKMSIEHIEAMLAHLFASQSWTAIAHTLPLVLPHIAPTIRHSPVTMTNLAKTPQHIPGPERPACLRLLVQNEFACNLMVIAGFLRTEEVRVLLKAGARLNSHIGAQQDIGLFASAIRELSTAGYDFSQHSFNNDLLTALAVKGDPVLTVLVRDGVSIPDVVRRRAYATCLQLREPSAPLAARVSVTGLRDKLVPDLRALAALGIPPLSDTLLALARAYNVDVMTAGVASFAQGSPGVGHVSLAMEPAQAPSQAITALQILAEFFPENLPVEVAETLAHVGVAAVAAVQRCGYPISEHVREIFRRLGNAKGLAWLDGTLAAEDADVLVSDRVTVLLCPTV